MTFAPSQLFQRLDELQLWQGNYDALFPQKSENLRDSCCQSDYETIEGLSVYDSRESSPRKLYVDHDNRAITSPIKPFEQLLEETLANNKEQPIVADKIKPKKPFLKKGQGLARFRMNTAPLKNTKQPVHKPHLSAKKCKTKDVKPNKTTDKVCTEPVLNKSPENIEPNYENLNYFKPESDFALTPLKMPELVMKPKGTWQKVSEIYECNKENNADLINDIIEKKKNITQQQKLQHQVPPKQKNVLSPVKQVHSSHSIMDKINEFALKHFLPKHYHENNKNIEQHSPKEVPSTPPNLGEQTLYEQQLERDLRTFEILEQKVENSSFCSTNTSIVNLLSSTPNQEKKQLYERKSRIILEEEASCENFQDCYDDRIPQPLKDKDLHEKMEEVTKKTAILQKFLVNLRKMNDKKRTRKDSNTSGKSTPSPKKNQKSPDTSFSDQEKWSTTTTEDSDCQTPSSFYTDNDTTVKTDTRVDIGTNTDFDCLEKPSKTLDTKFCENCEDLNYELEKWKRKFKDVQGQKEKALEQLEIERNRFEREMQKLRKKHEETLREANEEIETEKKKLSKQKMVFEKYVKDSQDRPNRRERQEISELKQEVDNLKELIKLKDSKNGSSQARLRNHVKQLEKDNAEHKLTIEKLQKDNAKLTANQKFNRRPSEVKMLHEINKNLSKLAEETLKKQTAAGVASGGDSGDVNNQCNNNNNINNNKTKAPQKHEDTLEGVLSKIKDMKSKSNRKCESSFGNETCPPHDGSNFASLPVEKQYDIVFGAINSPKSNPNISNVSSTEKIEKAFPDGSMEVVYTNGNIKTISPDGNFIRMKYFNGDIKETDIKEKTIRYYYLESNCWHIQFGDGCEVIEYPDGQKHKKYPDGKIEITYPEGSLRTINSDGTEEEVFPDGLKTIKNAEGEQIILLPNGQKEVHTSKHKRREYPDGTLRILYKDGTVETRYPNGRVRVKDPSGVLVMDTNEKM